MSIDHERINNTLGKFYYYLNNHGSISVSVSGGSDSDIMVHIIATYLREFLPKVHFVFVNTGLEYRATLRHIDYLEQRYNIRIDRIRGVSVVTAVRTNGVPIISKWHSEMINRYQRGLASGAKAINNDYGRLRDEKPHSKFVFSDNQRALVDALGGLKVSDSCCTLSKKKPLTEFQQRINADLILTGERKAEGGRRAMVHKSCFEPGNHGIDKYMPLLFWNDETKQWYKEQEGIRYSDCYEVWGMKRTGCVGCPFGLRIGDELQIMQRYEPNLYQACMNVFGESYRLMDKFGIRRKPILNPQISVFDVLDGGDNENNDYGKPGNEEELTGNSV